MRRILLTLCIIAGGCGAMLAQRPHSVRMRVMSVNVRLDNKNDGRNNWEMRFLPMGRFLTKSKSDVIGMQEVMHGQLLDMIAALKGYGYVGVGRDDGAKGGEYNPIFYNRDRFNLLRSGTFWLSPNSMEPSIGWDAACKRIATWAILQDKTTMKSLIVLNTHLDHIGSQSRINGASLIKERVSRMTNELPVVVMGDFNVGEEDPVYSRMLTGIFPMRDSFKMTKRHSGPSYTYHGYGQVADAERKRIDYIFISKSVKTNSTRTWDSALGRGLFLTDHNAVSADIEF